MAKVGFTAHPMHNSIRNMIGTLVLFCGGLVMSKIRILDSRWIGYPMVGDSNHRYGKYHNHGYHMGQHGYLAGVIFCKSHHQIFLMALPWRSATIFNWIMSSNDLSGKSDR